MQRAQTDLAPLAKAVSPGRGGFVDSLVALTQAEISELNHDADLSRLLRVSIEENVGRILEILADDTNPSQEPPHGAMEYAARLGASEASLASLLRAYRIGQARFTEHCLSAAAELHPPLGAAGQIKLVNAISAYIDRVCEHVTIIFQAEHDRWVSGRVGLTQAWVTRLLSDAEVDELAASTALSYDLAGPHLAVHVWAVEDAETLLTPAVQAIAELGDRGRLVMRRGQREAWIWLASRSVSERARQLGSLNLGEGFRLASGSPAEGRDGFRLTHDQATRVKRLLSRRPDVRQASWPELAPVAALTEDAESARDIVAAALGALAADGHRERQLRETLLVFLEHQGSHTATADALHMHRNTVHYRVQQALELIGTTDPTGEVFRLLSALHIARWLSG